MIVRCRAHPAGPCDNGDSARSSSTRTAAPAATRRSPMFGRFMPREGRFFELFSRHAGEIVQGSRELVAMMSGEGDMQARARAIETIEKRGDKIVRETL